MEGAAAAKVYALTDYYEGGREHYRAWMEAAFGYTDDIIGSHAGISDTSQMLHVRPTGVRKDQIKPWGGPKDSGVSGDPMKATAEIGRMGIEFKINAALNQYKVLKNPAAAARRAAPVAGNHAFVTGHVAPASLMGCCRSDPKKRESIAIRQQHLWVRGFCARFSLFPRLRRLVSWRQLVSARAAFAQSEIGAQIRALDWEEGPTTAEARQHGHDRSSRGLPVCRQARRLEVHGAPAEPSRMATSWACC